MEAVGPRPLSPQSWRRLFGAAIVPMAAPLLFIILYLSRRPRSRRCREMNAATALGRPCRVIAERVYAVTLAVGH